MKVVKTNALDKCSRASRTGGQRRIQIRLDLLIAGNPGDVKPIGGGISELRIVDYGPSLR